MQRICTLRRQSPKPRAENLTSSALKEIGIRNMHHVRWPPRKLAGCDHIVAFDGFHVRWLTITKSPIALDVGSIFVLLISIGLRRHTFDAQL
jgi:hypothetical protein